MTAGLPLLAKLRRILFGRVSLHFLVVLFMPVVLFTMLGGLLVQEKTLRLGIDTLALQNGQLNESLASASAQINELLSEDQYIKNKELESTISAITKTYTDALGFYEEIIDLPQKDQEKYEESFATILAFLSERNFASGSAALAQIKKVLADAKVAAAAAFTIPANVPASNAPPGSGYSRQQVHADIGTYLVDIVAADMAATRVIVDTASEHDCGNDCPVLSLGEYVARSAAYAGVNGSYFCPATYPSCADKKNSFDTLLMNKNNVYFNSDNNVYSTVPAVIFGSGWVRFVGKSLEWGRDTNVDGVIANQPLLIIGGNIAFGGSSDPKQGSKGARSFVGNRGNTIYIGVVHNATVAEVAHVLKAVGIENAINLDSGGSTALWSGGYKVGPGRNIPNAILFVRK